MLRRFVVEIVDPEKEYYVDEISITFYSIEDKQ